MDAGHDWRSKPGAKIRVADPGAIRFDPLGHWVVVVDDEGVKLQDCQSPDDE